MPLAHTRHSLAHPTDRTTTKPLTPTRRSLDWWATALAVATGTTPAADHQARPERVA